MFNLALAFVFAVLLVLTGAVVSCALALRKIAEAARFLECLANDGAIGGPLTDIRDVLRERLPVPIELKPSAQARERGTTVIVPPRSSVVAVDVDHPPRTAATRTPRRRRSADPATSA